MAKGVVRAVAALVVLSAAGIGGAWYMYSEKAVAAAKQLMAAYEELPLPNGSKAKLSYERVERTSFPNTGARFVNPVFEFSVPAGEQGQQAMLQTVKYQGPLDVVIDYVRSEVRLDATGAGEMTMRTGEETITAVWDNTDLHTMVKAKSRGAFNQWGTIDLKDSTSVTTAVRNIAAFSLAMGPMTIKDKTSGAMLFTQEAFTSSFINRTANEKANVDFTLTMRGSEASPAYAQAMERLIKGSAMPGLEGDGFQPFSLAHAGKQDVDIDISANMPDVPMGQPMPNGSLIVRKFALKNDFYVLSMPTEIILKEAQGQRKALAKLKWQVEVTKKGGEEMQRSVPMLSAMLPMLGDALKQADAAIDPEVLNQKVLAALPTMSDLGPVTLAVDIEAVVGAPTQAQSEPARQESIIIRDLTFSHKRWGIDAKGQAARHDKVPPTVDITLNCRRCDTMTQDMFTMANQTQDVMNFMTPERVQWDVSPELMARVNALLAEIGKKDDAAGDIVFAIASPTPGEYRINDKPFAEAMMKAMALTAPAAPQDQAPAAGAAAQ